MKKSNIVRSLDRLAEKDVYSVMMFMLYGLKDEPEYSALSELVYALDKDSLLNVLSLLGGTTVRIPTISELGTVLAGLMVYSNVNFNGMSVQDAMADVRTPDIREQDLMDAYAKISEAMSKYEFKPR